MTDLFNPNGPLFSVQKKTATRSAPASLNSIDLSVRELRKGEFAKRLNALKNEKGWNQSDLARAADMGRDSVSQYIRGNNIPNPKNLKKLADAFAVKPEELYPNYLASAVETEIPSYNFKKMPGDDEHTWVQINQKVPNKIAGKIFKLLHSS